jgi:hypothetical protein
MRRGASDATRGELDSSGSLQPPCDEFDEGSNRRRTPDGRPVSLYLGILAAEIFFAVLAAVSLRRVG